MHHIWMNSGKNCRSKHGAFIEAVTPTTVISSERRWDEQLCTAIVPVPVSKQRRPTSREGETNALNLHKVTKMETRVETQGGEMETQGGDEKETRATTTTGGSMRLWVAKLGFVGCKKEGTVKVWLCECESVRNEIEMNGENTRDSHNS